MRPARVLLVHDINMAAARTSHESMLMTSASRMAGRHRVNADGANGDGVDRTRNGVMLSTNTASVAWLRCSAAAAEGVQCLRGARRRPQSRKADRGAKRAYCVGAHRFSLGKTAQQGFIRARGGCEALFVVMGCH